MNGSVTGLIFGVVVLGGAGIVAIFGPFGEKPGLRGISEDRTALYDDTLSSQDSGEDAPPRSPKPAAASVQEPAARAFEGAAPPWPVVGREHAFPLAGDIPAGLERVELIRRYGPPAMRTASVENGITVETLIYIQPDPERKTFVNLRAGRVTSASTTAY